MLGIILSAVMGAANVYIGLKVGLTVSASIPAAVMAMLVFKFVFRRNSILEANQVQTAASAGESLAAGIIFTMPALILIGYWQEFDFWTVTGIAFTGGLLGILFMIPMRKVFVIGRKDLPYPEGIACAAVLEAGAGEVEGETPEEIARDKSAATALLFGGAIGALYKVAEKLFGLWNATLETAQAAGGRLFYYGTDVSPMLIAVGFIVRLNVSVLIFLGGFISWVVAIPIMSGNLDLANAPSLTDSAWDLWGGQIRYLGVGAMVVGGVAAIVGVREGLVTAVRDLLSRNRAAASTDDRDRDLPGGIIAGLSVVCLVLIAVIYYAFTKNVGITLVTTIAMVLMAFFFTAVASYIVGLVGNSNSPVSGMTITAVLATGGLLWLFGFTGMEFMVGTLGVAAVVCCVACTAGDVCNDLKTGSLVGAAPFRQQKMQILGVFIAALVMAPVLNLLHETEGGMGSRTLPAPQAQLFANLARGFAGEGDLPWHLIGIGAAVGLAIHLTDMVLKAKKAPFRLYLMPLAVGMYLPFGLATPILVGGLISWFVLRGARTEAGQEKRAYRGVLFSSGVIAGEALMGVGIAILTTTLGKDTTGENVVDGMNLGLPADTLLWTSLAACLFAVGAYLIFSKPAPQDRVTD